MTYKVYIAGPMTGYAGFNYDAFDVAATMLRAKTYGVLNPAEAFMRDQRLRYTDYMRSATHLVLQASAICLLPGWEGSKGARMEALVGVSLGLPFYEIDENGRVTAIPTPNICVAETAD